MLRLMRQGLPSLRHIRTMATGNSDHPVEDAIRSKVSLFAISLVLYAAPFHLD